MEPINWQDRPKSSICPHSIQSYGFNRFLERIRSWSPSNRALCCQECEKEEMGKSSKKTNEVPFGEKYLWVCLECDRIFCGAENLGSPDSHICSHSIKNNHRFAIPIDAGCLACKPVQQIMTLETNKELEINKELDSTIEVNKGLGSTQLEDFDNLACKSIPHIMALETNKELEINKELDSAIEVKKGSGATQIEDIDMPSGYVVRPMKNRRNTCFFIAILQNLLSISVLRSSFNVLEDFSEDHPITRGLWVLFLDTGEKDGVDFMDHTDLFQSICRRVPSFRGQQEEKDAYELLRQLLNLLLDEGTSFIQDIFGGKLSSTVSCVQCGNASKSYHPFLDLSLAIPSNECSTKNDEVSTPRDPVPSAMDNSSLQEKCLSEETHIVLPDPENVDLSSQFSDVSPRKRPRLEGQAQSGNNNGDPLSIEKCLNLFIAPEILCGEYVCDHCSNRSQDRLQTELQSTSKNEKFKEGEGLGGDEVMDEVKPAVESKEGVDVGSRKAEMKASKMFLIFKAPPHVLTIHLKRFSRDTNGIIKKINSHVNIRQLLDLTPYMDPSCEDKGKPRYSLIGVVEHLGASLRGGHYVAYVRRVRSEGQELVWFRASDDVVQEVSLNKVLDSEAYILFYESMGS